MGNAIAAVRLLFFSGDLHANIRIQRRTLAPVYGRNLSFSPSGSDPLGGIGILIRRFNGPISLTML